MLKQFLLMKPELMLKMFLRTLFFMERYTPVRRIL